MELRFIEYVKSPDKLNAIRLWQKLKAKAYGKYSSASSKRFGKFERAIAIDNKQLTFHSFRRTFAPITMSRYGKEYELEKMAEAIERLKLHRTAF